ncbi:MAG TPA: aldo/keto reductase [Actinomycetota bacterium]|nr:aldo/keto reductase [Actinomycetota bacterium]
MRTRTLGADGPEISVIGYGAWEAGGADWGPNASDDAVVDSMRVIFDVGINWIDTAEVYGQGRSEELVARAVAGRRDEVLIFTKVAPDEEGSGIHPEGIRKAIRGSLARLQTDHVDLYQVHWRDDRIPVEDTWGAMAEVVKEGLSLHIGVSNFDLPRIERCLPIHPVSSVQNQFSLVYQDDRAEFLPWLAKQGIGYLAYGPLGFGLLTDAIGPDTMFHPGDWRGQQRAGSKKEGIGPFSPENFERNLERVARLRSVAERLGIPVSTLALAWAIHQEGVTAAIAGSRDPAHVRSNAAAGDVTLDAPTLQEIDSIFGPE